MTSTNLKTAKPKAGIFIDGANLYYSQKQNRWKVDLHKLKYLISQDFIIILYQYYQAIPNINDPAFQPTQTFLSKIGKFATIRSKPLKYIKTGKKIVKKGDVDIEIVLDVVRRLRDLDVVIVISGDSDYLDLRRYILDKKKQIIFIGFKRNMAWELKQGKYLILDQYRKHLEQGKKTPETKLGRTLVSLLYQKTQTKSTQ